MSQPLTIARLGPDPDGLDYAALQKAGLTFVQELAGKHWTDYNAHDPGVTILDQLSYALTDLAYRSALPHEDYLAAADGAIDLEHHGLHRPQDILPSEPVTADDWRRLLYDRVPEIDDVWFDDVDGLVDIKLKAGDAPGAEHLAPTAVRTVFAAGRALCQDIARLTVLHTRNFYLGGDIEVRSMREPAAVYADIVFQCARLVGSGMRLDSYDHAACTTPALDDLLQGPFTEHGRISTGSRQPHAAISLLHLIGLIRGIEGVSKVHSLDLYDEHGRRVDGEPVDLPPGEVPRIPLEIDHPRLNLRFMIKSDDETRPAERPDSPDSPDRANLLDLPESADARHAVDDSADARRSTALNKAGRPYLNKLRFEHRALRERIASLEHLVIAPRGEGNKLDNYYSIQHQFPAMYGINAYGVPASAPPATHAAARQLKAYLYIFEQVMANYVHGVANLGHLFSLQHNVRRSYFSLTIRDDMLPDIEALYVARPHEIARKLDAIRASNDPHENRRDRVLDVMLALYGERYTQQSLRKFNLYFPTRQEFRRWLLENKRAFLLRIAELGKRRAAGFRYDLPAWNTDNVSGAHHKIAILLGLHSLRACRPLCAELRRHGLRIIDSYDGNTATATVAQLLDRLQTPAATPALQISRALFHGAFSGGDAMPAAMATLTKTQQRRLRLLNMKSEGFHLVEHTLLRPRRTEATDQQLAVDDYYKHQVSVLFPDWTARFASQEFRKLAQETVTLNLPAHVMPHFYWLSHDEMEQFEARYKIWLYRLRVHVVAADQTGGPVDDVQQALDTASSRLTTFLQALSARTDVFHWA